MQVSGNKARKMVMVSCTFQMVVYTAATLGEVWPKELEDCFTQMVMCMLENGKMIRHMAKEGITLSMEENIKESGSSI